MTNEKELLALFREKIEKVLVGFSADENVAIADLNALKAEMENAILGKETGEELFSACVYNALATINTAPNQKKKNAQLTEALCEAKDEISEIEKML